MLTKEEKQKRLHVLTRIAIAMAEKNGDKILGDIKTLTDTTRKLRAKPVEEIDQNYGLPVALQKDGGRYYPYVRGDGRGQIDIVWPCGIEKTLKFNIPEKYLAVPPPTPVPYKEEKTDSKEKDASGLMMALMISITILSVLGLSIYVFIEFGLLWGVVYLLIGAPILGGIIKLVVAFFLTFVFGALGLLPKD